MSEPKGPDAASGSSHPSADSDSSKSEPVNRLARESSPYLLLHQHNPVDWYPWGEEALERARAENKPIFLSVGYSTCYWCHVMERESFSDEGIARFMNERFINIKVDREERPDVDEIYMAATQILSGQGGWPNSVFLTPDLKPYYAGTYFPPRDMQGRPGFPTVVTSLADAWRDRRDDVRVQADEVADAMRRVLQDRFEPGVEPPPADAPVRAYEDLVKNFDSRAGGFGAAPKFPTPSNLYLLADLVRADGDSAIDPEIQSRAGEMLTRSLDAMARGGIYDQLAGGFHRYATDSAWLIPHFEKMLYDNGLLVELYALEFARTGDPEAARIATETVEFLSREMTSADGAFWSAIDAETDGHEGAYYVWTREEIDDALGAEDGMFLAPIYGFDRSPFFEGSHYVLHLPQSLHEVAAARKVERDELLQEIAPLRAKLKAVRDERKRPLTDDKILADWNGMAIRGLAVAGRVLDRDDWIERAAVAARCVLKTMRDEDGGLLHSVRAGKGRISAYLSDYVFLSRALFGLYEATRDRAWLDEAVRLTEEQIARLADERGGFFNYRGSEDLLFRAQEIFDGATPAANAVAVLNLLDLAAATKESRWMDLADRSLRAYSPMIANAPGAVRMLSMATGRWIEAGGRGASPETAPEPAQPHSEQPAVASESPVELRVDASEPDAEGYRTFELELAIADGWHLQAHEVTEEFLQPTVVDARGFELRNVRYPDGESVALGFRDEELNLYRGRVRIRGEMRRDPARDEGELIVIYQACDDRRCLAPERVVVLRIG